MPRADRTLDRMRANPATGGSRRWKQSLSPMLNIRGPGGMHVVFKHPAVAESNIGCGAAADQAGLFPPLRLTIRRLTEDEGGGWLIEFPDLPGCMSDGADRGSDCQRRCARRASPAC